MSELPLAQKALVDELEDRAYRNEDMPKGLSFPEQLLYQKLRYLYALARIEKIPKERGKRVKDEILSDYMLDCINAYIYRQCVEMMGKIKAYATAIMQDEELMQHPKVSALLSFMQPYIGNGVVECKTTANRAVQPGQNAA